MVKVFALALIEQVDVLLANKPKYKHILLLFSTNVRDVAQVELFLPLNIPPNGCKLLLTDSRRG